VKNWSGAAAISGFLVVLLGAFGAHGLSDVLDARGQDLWRKAVLYQMFHTVALLGIALLQGQRPAWRLSASGIAFCCGIVIFSGTLFAMALGAPRWLGAVTPLGGTAFLVGWAWLAWTAFRNRS
jgi:uncharacterized membrane protein YgdD (TMEM256/DUF423 family)